MMIKPGILISDRYEIIEKVGSGGMADVYKAKCHRLNRFVAIKILKPEFSSDRSFVNKFRGEAQSAAGLSHPNIVNVYDVGDDDGLHYIVMELVEGITLKKFIERKGKLEVKEAIGISIQIAQGMEAAHANHIIHRDIKPQNIIISKEGKVKVTDFGIAKATTSNTITSNAMGSVHYLSPEQARGGYSDEKSDIYSLGVTMYEMLAGQVPFAGDNNVSVALAHIQGEAAPLREINPEIPHGVDMIVQKCMQKKPERRYLTASDLIVDLKKAIVNPDGDFVKLVAPIVMDSPTISLSEDDMNKIKSSTGNIMTDYERSMSVQNDDLVDDYDDEDIDAVDPRITKILIIFAIPVVIIIIIVIVWIVSMMLSKASPGTNTNNNTGIEQNNPFDEDLSPTPSITTDDTDETSEYLTMIDVVNLTEEEAKAALQKLSADFDITSSIAYSDEVEKGKVMEQFPSKESQISTDSKILLTISAGPEEFQLENYVGMQFDEANRKMSEIGLIVTKNEINDETMEAGKIISTVPEEGSLVTKGTEIVVVVSKGSELVTVPRLLNMKEEDAKKAIESAGLVVGTITRSSSDEFAEGEVKYQSYSYNEKVPAGTTIDISISTGPEQVPSDTPEDEETTTPEVTDTPEEPIPGEEDGEEKTYYGSITIQNSPFDEGVEGGEVILDLSQNGVSSLVFKEYLTAADFPLVRDIESDSGDTGTITMYIDNVPYTETTWKISFSEKEE